MEGFRCYAITLLMRYIHWYNVPTRGESSQ